MREGFFKLPTRAQIGKAIREQVVDRLLPDKEGYLWSPVTIGNQTIGTAGDRFRFRDTEWVKAIHPNQDYAVIIGSFGNGRLDFGIAQFGEVGVKGFLGHKEERCRDKMNW